MSFPTNLRLMNHIKKKTEDSWNKSSISKMKEKRKDDCFKYLRMIYYTSLFLQSRVKKNKNIIM